MLFGFIFVGYCGPIAIVLLVLAIQIKCFHEVHFKGLFSSGTSHYFEIRIMVLDLAVNEKLYFRSLLLVTWFIGIMNFHGFEQSVGISYSVPIISFMAKQLTNILVQS